MSPRLATGPANSCGLGGGLESSRSLFLSLGRGSPPALPGSRASFRNLSVVRDLSAQTCQVFRAWLPLKPFLGAAARDSRRVGVLGLHSLRSNQKKQEARAKSKSKPCTGLGWTDPTWSKQVQKTKKKTETRSELEILNLQKVGARVERQRGWACVGRDACLGASSTSAPSH